MFSLRETVHVFILIQVVSSELISFKHGEVSYEYDNECEPLGNMGNGILYKGTQKEGSSIVDVVFKEVKLWTNDTKMERDAYERIGSHLYGYCPEKNVSIIVELLGRTLFSLLKEYGYFSAATVMRIGLQVLDALDHIHEKGVLHGDIVLGNLAIGYTNPSRIYVFDFSLSLMYQEPFEDQKIIDFSALSIGLKEMAYGLFFEYKSNVTNSCKTALDEFAQKARNINPNLGKLRAILLTELEKHKNKPNYDKFEWEFSADDEDTPTEMNNAQIALEMK